MKTIVALAPLALLATLAGCVAPASEAVGESDQAVTGSGAWSGLPVAINGTEVVTCTHGDASVALTITPGTSGITYSDVTFYFASKKLCASSSSKTLSAGQSAQVSCTSPAPNSAEVVVDTDASGDFTLALTNVLDDLESFSCEVETAAFPIVWYSGASQAGTATGETTANGTCVDVSSLSLGYTPESLALSGQASATTYIDMFTGSGCSGTVYERSAGAGTVHDIDLATVGIGANLASYMVTW